MPHLTITGAGEVVYRTRLMPYERAQAFALCLRRNGARFANVDLVHSDRATGSASWFVTSQPVNEDRRVGLVDSVQAQRADRADKEGRHYVFAADPDARAPFYWCLNPLTGETYEVTGHSCTCPDWEYRCRRAALRCKHILALTWRLQAGEIPAPMPVRLAPPIENPRCASCGAPAYPEQATDEYCDECRSLDELISSFAAADVPDAPADLERIGPTVRGIWAGWIDDREEARR